MAIFVKNYLQKRTFRSKVGNCLSDRKVQEEGTPQGSVISALLFMIAMDSILDTIYAHDLSITIKSSTLKGVELKAQRIMSLLERWSNETGFIFSSDKTKMILFSKRRVEGCGEVRWRRDLVRASSTEFWKGKCGRKRKCENVERDTNKATMVGGERGRRAKAHKR